MLLCCAPFGAVCAAPVATTSGSNLTAFNPSNVNNNQWAMMTNGRYDGNNTPAKANFGNCNSVILRCAQPKCANGGCATASVAADIVDGCVKSNDSCKQYGDDLVRFMTAQLVATSTAKVKEQELAVQAAAAQAAAAANSQSQQQMQQMQQQMQQMQQQMQQQQYESQQQLQNALAQQQAQSAAALNEMKTAATNAAMEDEAGLSAYQKEAIERGINADVLERQKIAGQIRTEIEDAEVSVKAIETALKNSFDYARCDARGNNCEGPHRVKKWRELASGFIEPYNNAIDKVYEALITAQGSGIDLSQIYMMLDNSCSAWGQYMCPQMTNGTIIYSDVSEGQKGVPYVCPVSSAGSTKTSYENCEQQCDNKTSIEEKKKCLRENNCYAHCSRCTMLKMLSGEDAVYEGWINAENDTKDGNVTVVACASGVLDSATFFASRTRRKNGANLIDIEVLDAWINQTEPTSRITYTNTPQKSDYCYSNKDVDGRSLRASALKKTVDAKSMCCKDDIEADNQGCSGGTDNGVDGCSYVNPIYAICDTHSYNIGRNDALDRTLFDEKDCLNQHLKDAELKNGKQIKWASWKDANKKECEVKLCRSGFVPNRDKTDCESCTRDPEDENDECNLGGDKEVYEEYNRRMSDASGANEIKERIGLKTTVVSQQMYKQYEYLKATIRRLKIQLEKAIVKTNLEAAGADTKDSSSGLLSGLSGSGSNDKKVVLPGAENCANSNSSSAAYKCLQNNVSVIIANASGNRQKACKQLQETIAWAKSWKIKPADECDGKDCGKDKITECAQSLNHAIIQKIEDKEDAKNNRFYGYGLPGANSSKPE